MSTARVLEIGCAGGGNLIPFAAAHPQAHVVGIDLSQVQIDQGRARAQALGLDNLELLAGDIARMDLDALGQFDFVIAHGVYSWVPPEVQEALLSAFRRLLAPEGVAYVSYNVYPGWKSKEILRDAMLLASGDSTTPDEKVREARGMVDFLEEVASADGVLARVLADIQGARRGFRGFLPAARRTRDVQRAVLFLRDAGPRQRARPGLPGRSPPRDDGPRQLRPQGCGISGREVRRRPGSGGAVPRLRRSTACSANHCWFMPNARRRSSYNPDRSRLRRLHFAAWVPPVDGQTRLDHSRQEYRESDGATLFTNDPGIKAALDALSARWPWTLSRQELVDAVHARLVAAGLKPSADLAGPRRRSDGGPDHAGAGAVPA